MRSASAMDTTPIGRLMRKIQRQLAASTTRPPRLGPIAVASPLTPPQMPMAAPRLSAGNTAATMLKVLGIIAAPPSPCTTRKATSSSMLGARPQASDESVKSAMPATKSSRRPYRSPRRPSVTSVTANIST